ncbi:MAG: RNA polymerase sigma factor [Chloroflexota bacterium]
MLQQPDMVDATFTHRQSFPMMALYGGQGGTQQMDMSMTIQAARSGDETAFTNLVIYYKSAAERVAQHILKTEDAAADAVQEAFIKVHKAMKRFQDGNFRSWLLRIVTNTCYDHLRKEKRRAALSLDELTEQTKVDVNVQPTFLSNTEETSDPEFQAIRSETMENLLSAIDQLPHWHRNVVLLIDVHGYDYAETAELLELPLGTIKSRLSRARASLRQEWIETGVIATRPQ